MSKDMTGHSQKSAHTHEVERSHEQTKSASLLPNGSWQRTAAGVTAAAGGGLLAAAVLGVGPAAVAGAAGYLAYRALSEPRNDDSGRHDSARHDERKH